MKSSWNIEDESGGALILWIGKVFCPVGPFPDIEQNSMHQIWQPDLNS